MVEQRTCTPPRGGSSPSSGSTRWGRYTHHTLEHVHIVNVRRPWVGDSEYIEINSLEAWKEWQEKVIHCDEMFLMRYAMTIDSSRWDHMRFRRGEAVMNLATLYLNMGFPAPMSPLEAFVRACNEYRAGILRLLVERGTVLLTKAGGFSYLGHKDEVLSRRPFEATFRRPLPIWDEEAVVVNLENDPVPELFATEYMEKRWGKFNVVLCLWEYEEGELCHLFNMMRRRKVRTVYVYTTGMDVEKMYQYLRCTIKSRIPNLVMDFVGKENDRHMAFLAQARRAGLNVEHRFLGEENENQEV